MKTKIKAIDKNCSVCGCDIRKDNPQLTGLPFAKEFYCKNCSIEKFRDQRFELLKNVDPKIIKKIKKLDLRSYDGSLAYVKIMQKEYLNRNIRFSIVFPDKKHNYWDIQMEWNNVDKDQSGILTDFWEIDLRN